MKWDYEMAKELKKLAPKSGHSALMEGKVVRLVPLTLSLYGGQVMAPPMPLRMTELASGREWKLGQTALCVPLGKSLVVIDRLS